MRAPAGNAVVGARPEESPNGPIRQGGHQHLMYCPAKVWLGVTFWHHVLGLLTSSPPYVEQDSAIKLH